MTLVWEFLTWLFEGEWPQALILVPLSVVLLLGMVAWMDSRHIRRSAGGRRAHKRYLKQLNQEEWR